MTTSSTTLLGLALPVTGEESGTWGDLVNNSITSLVDSAIAGGTALTTDADVTLSTTNLAANQARQAILICSGARTAQRTITAPARSKVYCIINATTGGFGVKLVGVGPTTGVTIVNGTSAVVAWNGSDFVFVSSTDISKLSGVMPVTTGGTGATTLTGLLLGNGTSAVTTVAAPSGTVVGTSDSQTLTNKRITIRSVSYTSATSVSTFIDTYDMIAVTALATPMTFPPPSGTPTEGQKLIFRIKDNGTARALTWTTTSGSYRAVGTSLPTTTVAGKVTYIGAIYNSQDVYWDVITVVTQT